MEKIHLGDYLPSIDDAVVREKVSLYITRHPPLQSILRQAIDEDDTFLQADIQSYTHLLSPLSDFKYGPFEENSLLIREYLRRMIDEEPFIHQEYISPNFSEFSSRFTNNQNLELLEVEQLLKQNTRIVILGSSGIGKTYLIKYLQATYATAIIEQDVANATSTSVLRPHFPIPLKSSLLTELDVIKKSPMFILELVKQNFQRLGIQSIDQVMTSVTRFFEKGQCILMIDALDEIPDEKRLLFEEIFNEFSAMYPGNIYLVTMRTSTFSTKNRLAAFKPFVLHPWTSEQINCFVNS
jgi:predicted NACHT family NTPase